jgi:hypothetical protein
MANPTLTALAALVVAMWAGDAAQAARLPSRLSVGYTHLDNKACSCAPASAEAKQGHGLDEMMSKVLTTATVTEKLFYLKMKRELALRCAVPNTYLAAPCAQCPNRRWLEI